jgi:hypothetical protein
MGGASAGPSAAPSDDPFNPEEPYKLRLVGHSLGGASALIYLVRARCYQGG